MAARDYYDILGVKSDASDEEIKRREDKENNLYRQGFLSLRRLVGHCCPLSPNLKSTALNVD